MGRWPLLLVTLVSIWPGSTASASERIETIATRPGVTQGLYVVTPDRTSWAAAILYTGGDGMIGLEKSQPLTDNFLIRIKSQLSEAGIALVYPDVPSDHRGYGTFRSDPRHVEDAAAVLSWMRSWTGVPLFVIGTSRGTVSAANIAAHIAPDTIAGVALTSSVTRTSRAGLGEIESKDLARIRSAVLIMAHRDDRCSVTPPDDVPFLMKNITAAARKESIVLTGGIPPKSDPCEALSAHGYYGIEDEAAQKLVDWMRSVVETP